MMRHDTTQHNNHDVVVAPRIESSSEQLILAYLIDGSLINDHDNTTTIAH